MKLLSIIFSFRNEEKNIPELIERISSTLKKLNNWKFELIFVNDDSDDNSEKILVDSDYYILNIWSSWCGPCRKEHPKLMELSKNPSVKLIGINYRDNPKNAKNFIKKFGNPFSFIFVDINGIISIELGAYGVPETIVVNKDRKIIKKFVMLFVEIVILKKF